MKLTAIIIDDEFDDRRPQRRRYEESTSTQIRKKVLSLAESKLHSGPEEALSLAKLVSDHYDEVEARNSFFDLVVQVVLEQPLKIPFVAATVLLLNGLNRGEEAVAEVLARSVRETESLVKEGEWRGVKCLLKFLGGLQGLLGDEGVFPVLTDLLDRSLDLQTASSDDVSFLMEWDEVCYSRPWLTLEFYRLSARSL